MAEGGGRGGDEHDIKHDGKVKFHCVFSCGEGEGRREGGTLASSPAAPGMCDFLEPPLPGPGRAAPGHVGAAQRHTAER